RLMDLLDDAVNRAREVVREKNPDLPREELDRIAEQAGIGAVKYADLSTSRIKDYVFDVDRMVSFTGNTGVYLQYAHTRIRSILRKAGDPDVTVDPSIALHPAERALALELDDFGPPGGGRRDARAAQALRLPVRPRPRLHHVLRGLSGAQRRGTGPQQPACAVPADRPHPATGARLAGHQRSGTDVT